MNATNTADPQADQLAAGNPREAKAERSTIAFPYNDLDDGEAIAKAVQQVGGTTCQIEQLAAQLGVVHNSGPFRLRIQAAKVFGLVTSAQGTVTLTPLGNRLCDSKQERTARTEAFLTVPLYRRLYDKFKGTSLPPTAGLEAEMVNLGVAPKQKDKARQSFQRSARSAGFFWAGNDRLVMPKGAAAATVSDEPEIEDGDVEDEKGKVKPKNSGDDGAGRHPFIAGLLKELPAEGAEWATEERRKWLQAAAMIFDLIYRNGGSGRALKIEIEGSAK